MRPELRDYQRDAMAAIRAGFANGHKRQVLVAPTGAGKSVIAHEIVASAVSKGRRVLFVVNRVQLVQQFSERLTRAGLDHGIMRGEDSRREYMPVIVGSVQTIARRGLPDKFDVVVIDEAHAVPGSKDYIKIIREHQDSAVLGLTATPWAKGMAANDSHLGGPLFQGVVAAAQYSLLIQNGHLVDCDCYAPTVPDLKGVRTQKNQFGERDYVEADLGKAVNKPQLIGDIVEHWNRLSKGKPTVVFASSIAHSKAIVEAFVGAGVAAEHIDAYCDHDERRRIMARVDSGQTTIISCAALLAEGWDQPSISTMILARPTKSMIRFVQMAGRILRPHPGKERALLLDHSGTVLRLGFPTQDRDYELDDGKPRQTTGHEKQERLPSKCPKCGFVDPHRANPCEVCGHRRGRKVDAENLDGELKKLTKPVPIEEDKQRWYSELLYIQRERGYKPGWVGRMYKNKFGVWPRGLWEMPVKPSERTQRWVKSQAIRFAKGREAYGPHH